MLSLSKLKALAQKPLRHWLLLWAGVIILYIPAWKGGFQQDFHGWMMMFTDLPFWDVIDRKGTGIHSFYQLTQLQLYVWTWLFGTHQLPWFLLFTALHALNGTLLFRLCSRIFADFQLPNHLWIAAAGSLIFLANPGMTEAVIWKACYHYLIALQIVLWILIWAHRYLRSREPRYAVYAGVLFLLSTLTLEIWFTIPWLVLLLGAAYRRAGLISGAAFGRLQRAFFFPMLLIFAGYLVLYHQRYGVWMAHGAYNSPEDASIPRLAGRIWSYEGHLLAAARLWPHEARQWLYRSLAGGSFGWIAILALLGMFAVYAFLRFPKAGPHLRTGALLGAWSLIGLFVVLHFSPDELFYISNDRYLYFTAAFQAMLVAVLTGMLLPRNKKAWIALTTIILIACVSLTTILVWQWRRATKTFWGIQYNYRWDEAPLVLLLNLPCIYNGIGIIHANRNEEFGEHLRIFYNRKPTGKIVDVAAYNMQHAHDGAHVRVLDSMRIKVTLNQDGSWWWHTGLGMREYENEYYAVQYDNAADGSSYTIRLKQRIPGTVLLFSQGMQWREVNMLRKDEQW